MDSKKRKKKNEMDNKEKKEKEEKRKRKEKVLTEILRQVLGYYIDNLLVKLVGRSKN